MRPWRLPRLFLSNSPDHFLFWPPMQQLSFCQSHVFFLSQESVLKLTLEEESVGIRMSHVLPVF